MYTKFDDLDMMKRIRSYLAINPNATRQEICKNCFTNTIRLKKLEQEGYNDIPKPLNRGDRNGLKQKERESLNEVSISM